MTETEMGPMELFLIREHEDHFHVVVSTGGKEIARYALCPHEWVSGEEPVRNILGQCNTYEPDDRSPAQVQADLKEDRYDG